MEDQSTAYPSSSPQPGQRIEPSTVSSILTPDMADAGISMQAEAMREMDVSGLDPKQFATLVAEMTAVYLPEGTDVDNYKKRYVALVTPFLILGGLEKLTANMNLGNLVDRHPWIGVTICGAATVLGVFVCWPKPAKPETQEVSENE